MKRIALMVAGWTSLLVGIAGLFLPIIQGWFFILLGLFLLSSEYVWAHHLLSRLRHRFPKLAQAADKAMDRLPRWMHHRAVERRDKPTVEAEEQVSGKASSEN